MAQPSKPVFPLPSSRLIEDDAFPIEFLSTLAERESWRKEIYRPVYYLHKWWAKRLGSVFRGILLGCLLPNDADFQTAFYQAYEWPSVTVFDPFMGGGTTIGEAHKLGATVLGRDINPVACESVRVALGPLDAQRLEQAFAGLYAAVGERIRALYQAVDAQGQPCEVLYYFWVKVVACPACAGLVDLFSTYIFARNAYPQRKPEVQVYCPYCQQIFAAQHGDTQVCCPHCARTFNPQVGPAAGTQAQCPRCAAPFSLVKAVQAGGHAPQHRLYAKLVLTATGEKQYLPITPEDHDAYARCSALLAQEVAQGHVRLPEGVLAEGYNTRQALNYHYRQWRDFFNDRQLLALGWLQHAIVALPDAETRDAFLTLFSGVLEFNNLFASYKGEGTGAVRHMFSHHILKPERTPLEANVWGTPKSSGSFSNLYPLRMRRALAYRAQPFEVALNGEGKVYPGRRAFSGQVKTDWPPALPLAPGAIYLSCGSSDATGLADKSVDLVVTDPPFFDNVHYSELADFFYAWQKLYPHGFIQPAETTRQAREVQDADVTRFSAKLQAVFAECHRVLKDGGQLVFTYHHSRAEGWRALAEAIVGAGFAVVNAHPVKAELALATPKAQAKEPIQLDIILVCRKQEDDVRSLLTPQQARAVAIHRATAKLQRLSRIGLRLSRNDRRIVLLSQFLAALGPIEDATQVVASLDQQQTDLEAVIEEIKAEAIPLPKQAQQASYIRKSFFE